MDWQDLSAEWREHEGPVREHWAALTDDEFDAIDGDRDRLLGMLEDRYGVSRDEAERDLDDFIRGFDQPAR